MNTTKYIKIFNKDINAMINSGIVDATGDASEYSDMIFTGTTRRGGCVVKTAKNRMIAVKGKAYINNM